MSTFKAEIKDVIWIDKAVFNNENQGYKKIMEKKYGLIVREFNNAEKGIEAIKNAEIYSPIYIITSGSIYPEFYKFFKAAVTYIKNLPVQIIFTSSTKNFLNQHSNDEIGKQIGKFYNLGGVTDLFSQVEEFIQKTNKKLKDYKVSNLYEYKKAQDFRGLQTFTYLNKSESLYLPSFYKDIINHGNIQFNETSILINFMLNNFGNPKICELLKGMILFNGIPEPILSKFFARAYTLESSFYGIMNQNLMKKNYNVYSTYIKLLYKGIINNSYKPKTDCNLYRGTKLENFEIQILKNIIVQKKAYQEVPIIYSTSFLSFSTDNKIAKNLGSRRVASKANNTVIINLKPLKKDNEREILKTNAFLNQISAFHSENEVLFFPFSSFELLSVDEYDEGTLIVLDYSFQELEKSMRIV